MTLEAIKAYLSERRDKALAELLELLSIPSVSTDRARAGDTERCARWVARHLQDSGLSGEVVATNGHPIVYGERLARAGGPTLLIYGHYDVQPPDPLALWRHPPFEPALEEGYVYARGASDDKGQFYALLKGIEAYLKCREPPAVSIKVLIEGEEEVGSPNLLPFVRAERERLACDAVVIADCSQFARGVPAITYGLKGLVYLEVIVRGAKQDLHSGSYGGAVANPANALARMIAACHGPFGKVAIPGFYDGVREIEAWEREAFAALPFDEARFRAEIGAPALTGEEGYTTLERKWARPTFDVNGLVSGFTGEGAKTVLPCEARGKLSMRLVPDQDPGRIRDLTRAFLLDVAPPGVTVEVLEHHGAKPVIVPREGRAVQAAARALEAGFGREPVFVREGGSIPVVNTFQEELRAPSLLIGLGLPDDNLHAPNERFLLESYHRGAVTMAALLEELAER
jgi:acetylornithine deacetylase/succinyl-diaminopimelate desuccinylase-like protein